MLRFMGHKESDMTEGLIISDLKMKTVVSEKIVFPPTFHYEKLQT